MKENEIRDLLVQDLSILSHNYQFLEKEKYLPSDIGTRSFIDILAHDSNGKYIIIELKRSNATAREAIHELFKYLEAVKENLSVRADEIELVIVSTEWDELLVPFSSFVANVELNVSGFKLFISNNGLSAKRIETTTINEERILSAHQMALYYVSEESLHNGIKDHCNYFQRLNLENFVLVILKAPENYREMVLASLKEFAMKNFGESDMSTYERVILDYKYMIYSSNQLVPLGKYHDIFLMYPELEDSVDEIMNNDISTLDKMEQLNHLLLEIGPFPKADYGEIGTPAKYHLFREGQGWELIEIQRFGSLSKNKILSDDLIEQEILGASGTTGEKFISSIDFSNKANITRIKREAGNCLSDNIVWRNHIFNILDILQNEKIKKARCSIYNPMNIIYSIYLILSRPDGFLYVPSYQIEVELEHEKRMYIGYLDGKIKDIKLDEVFHNIDGFGEFELMLSLSHGGYLTNNLEICNYIGLSYSTMLIVVKDDEEKDFYKYEDYKFTELNNLENLPVISFCEQLFENKKLAAEIYLYFKSREKENGFFEF